MKPWIALLLIWGLAFILAEAAGVVVSSQVSSLGLETLGTSVGQLATISVRILALVYFASIIGIPVSAAYKKPLPSKLPLLLATSVAVAILAYVVDLATSLGGRVTTLIHYSNFIVNGALWTVAFSVAYYMSEIVLLNYLYMVAKKSWSILGSPALAAMLFLILAWASLHAITQSLVTAVYAIALVPIFYLSYEHTGRSPISPMILWFVTLVF